MTFPKEKFMQLYDYCDESEKRTVRELHDLAQQLSESKSPVKDFGALIVALSNPSYTYINEATGAFDKVTEALMKKRV